MPSPPKLFLHLHLLLFSWPKLFLHLLHLLLFSCPASSTSYSIERDVLLRLKETWGRLPALDAWNSSDNGTNSHCSWPGITCEGGVVVAISLPNVGIVGAVPSSVCDLRSLAELDLSDNNIPGRFPSIFNCSQLGHLNLSQNYFDGPIPSEIDQLRNLRRLDMSGNNLFGDIPASIGNLSKLVDLYLQNNLFNGSYPVEIAQLSQLENLELTLNRFLPSRLPPEFGRLKKLKQLCFWGTNLIGEIPISLSNLTELEKIDFTGNNLTGKIPDGLLQLKELKHLYLNFNNLSGRIPQSVASLHLEVICLAGNELTGPIPEDFGKLQRLRVLHLYYNRLSGDIPAGIGSLPLLAEISLFNNSLTGVLPPELGAQSNLELLDVANNELTGGLPENLCKAGALSSLVVFSNQLTGEVPESLGSCNSLAGLQLYDNRLSGAIPPGVWSLERLHRLMIGKNLFSGELPDQLGRDLRRIEISDNNFSGEIPSKINTSTELEAFIASNNQLAGEIPIALTALSKLNVLNLAGNQISGELPSKILSWKSVTVLDLSRNSIAGEIPASFAALKSVRFLNLSHNSISGRIPAELGAGIFTELDLSSNKFSGEVPGELQNQAYAASFLNNPGLCADGPSLHLRRCIKIPGGRRIRSWRFVAAVSVAAALLVSLAAAAAFLVAIRDVRTLLAGAGAGRRGPSHSKTKHFHHPTLNGATIYNAMKSKKELELGHGGSGTVYRVKLEDHPIEYVAVKKINYNNNNKNYNVESLEKAFNAEVEILGTIRHANIVKLLCCLSGEGEKLLVYEYVENCSLDRWIHGERSSAATPRLGWPARHRIAVGAARGLAYMHHHCRPAIVHRDVKSSNILLDAEMGAKIADFGLARMLAGGPEGPPESMSVVAGSFGYIAPEYAHTKKVDLKCDVYSFGVVLLELVTSRDATDGGEDKNLAQWAWEQNSSDESLEAALDKEMIAEKDHMEGMVVVFQIGLMCTMTEPSHRPSMQQVLLMLEDCGPPMNSIKTRVGYNSEAQDHSPSSFAFQNSVTGSSCSSPPSWSSYEPVHPIMTYHTFGV